MCVFFWGIDYCESNLNIDFYGVIIREWDFGRNYVRICIEKKGLRLKFLFLKIYICLFIWLYVGDSFVLINIKGEILF